MSNLVVFLDFGYPLGQAVYVSLALVVLLSLGKFLGGVMKRPVLLLLLAFILQYAADFNFLYSHTMEHGHSWVMEIIYTCWLTSRWHELNIPDRALARGFAKSSRRRQLVCKTFTLK